MCDMILKERLRKKMPRRVLSEKAGVCEQTIAKIESQEVIDPKTSTMFRICKVLDIDIIWVFEEFTIGVRN